MQQPEPFRIPAFRDFVPVRLQPWVYVVFAFCFQLSGARYLGALDAMEGDESLMREDLLMCLYANLAGMAMYFPMLFRMKFRFTNKTLLTTSALMVAATNIATAYCNVLPVLWLLCFVEGIFKLQGTFECISNIQLWFTPRRDFTVFFPVLHLFIMGSMHVSGFYAAWYGYLGDWRLTHWTTTVLMLVVLIILTLTTHHRRIIPLLPLYGIDWGGWALWSAFWLQIAWLLTYGDWMSWTDSPTFWLVSATATLTFIMAVRRMMSVRHPYINPQIFRIKYVKPILLLIVVMEAIMGSERVLEEVCYAEVMHYSEWIKARMELVGLAGCWAGCLFSLWWMKTMRLSYIRLVIVGLSSELAYLVGMYLTISPTLPIEAFYVPVVARSFAATVLAVAMMTSLQDAMTFQTFFQGLSLFNIFHMFVGGCVGGAVYARGLSYYVAEGLGRYGSWLTASRLPSVSSGGADLDFGWLISQMLAYAVKNVYGWTIFACIALLLGFLLYDSPLRRHTPRMPSWRELGMTMRRPFVRRRGARA